MSGDVAELKGLLLRQAQELKSIREVLVKLSYYVTQAESEVPEHIRRFMNYMHDLHDIKYMYEELGHAVPQHHLREMERCDDRFRQLMEQQNAEGGTFNKVRREMAADPNNRWDHTRQLAKPQEQTSCDKDQQAVTLTAGESESQSPEP